MTEDINKVNPPLYKVLLRVFGIIILIVVVLVLAFFVFRSCISGKTGKANMSDIQGYWTDNITSRTYTFIPNVNIEELEFEFVVYSSNKEPLQYIYKEIGNVKKGQQYTVTISITDLYIQTMWEGSYIRVTVNKGLRTL